MNRYTKYRKVYGILRDKERDEVLKDFGRLWDAAMVASPYIRHGQACYKSANWRNVPE